MVLMLFTARVQNLMVVNKLEISLHLIEASVAVLAGVQSP